LRLDFIHPNGNDVYAYQFSLSNTTVVSQISSNLPANLPIPNFNLVVATNYSNPNYWTESIRFASSLTNVALSPTNATTLAQLNSLSATVIGGTSGQQVLGTVQAGFTNNVFSYTLNWTGSSWPVQEVGWTFQMPLDCTNFSWSRVARWTAYPPTDIARATGTATPASTNLDATDANITNAFDFNSTKYNCTWASLTSAAGDGLRLSFGPQLFHCRAGAAINGQGYVLYANQQVSTANDISANIVPEEYMTLSSGNVVSGSFIAGSNSNLISGATAGGLSGPISVLFPTGGGFNGNEADLNFSGYTNASYSVWTSTNLLNWFWAGTAVQSGPGQYQFADPGSTNSQDRFYRVSSP
jgi:hypothetical protein